MQICKNAQKPSILSYFSLFLNVFLVSEVFLRIFNYFERILTVTTKFKDNLKKTRASSIHLKGNKHNFPEISPPILTACKQTLFFDFFKKLLYNIYRKLKIILSEKIPKERKAWYDRFYISFCNIWLAKPQAI